MNKYEYHFVKVTGSPGQKNLSVEIPDESEGWKLQKETIAFSMGTPIVMHTWRRRVAEERR